MVKLETPYAYTRGSEHPARGPIGKVSEHSVGRFYRMGTKVGKTRVNILYLATFARYAAIPMLSLKRTLGMFFRISTLHIRRVGRG